MKLADAIIIRPSPVGSKSREFLAFFKIAFLVFHHVFHIFLIVSWAFNNISSYVYIKTAHNSLNTSGNMYIKLVLEWKMVVFQLFLKTWNDHVSIFYFQTLVRLAFWSPSRPFHGWRSGHLPDPSTVGVLVPFQTLPRWGTAILMLFSKLFWWKNQYSLKV